MKTVGIIAEFNPFHNGHKHLIEQARLITGADYVVIVMSGSFTQRGTPAWMYKYDRTRIALICGADVVLELPISYSTASAEAFAYGGVSILNALSCIDYLAFGSECGDITILQNIADLLLNPTEEYLTKLNEELEKGASFPLARANALSQYKNILENPNNILGIEYIKAIKRLGSTITPITISRNDKGYHDLSLDKYASAASIRSNIDIAFLGNKNSAFNISDEVKEALPKEIRDFMENQLGITYPISVDDFDELIHYSLLNNNVSSISHLQDLNVDIANRIYNLLPEYIDINSFISSLKTKELTYTRLSRALIHILLDMKDLTRNQEGNLLPCPYTRVLGFMKDSQNVMHEISVKSTIPIVTKAADASKLLDPVANELFEISMRSDRIYDLVLNKKAHIHRKDGYKLSPVII